MDRPRRVRPTNFRTGLLLPDLPRAFVSRTGPEGIASMHIYGGRERPLADHRTGEEGMRISDRSDPLRSSPGGSCIWMQNQTDPRSSAAPIGIWFGPCWTLPSSRSPGAWPVTGSGVLRSKARRPLSASYSARKALAPPRTPKSR